jgi:hypothetical protein
MWSRPHGVTVSELDVSGGHQGDRETVTAGERENVTSLRGLTAVGL